jgi:glycosyltransferase involved in cell wall biosynthesis/predicted O-methyltransferase YrrM
MNCPCLVSVVIPCFNGAKYLAGAVRSVVAQQIPGTEIIIVDDQSTDDSRRVAQSLAEQCPGVRLIQQPVNAGPSAARNVGLRNASGRYVCFLDADDEYVSGFFATALPILERDLDLAAVATGVELIDCQREVHPVQLQAAVGSFPSNVMVRRAVVELIGGFPEGGAFRGRAAGEDFLFKNALVSWFKVVACEGNFLRYRVRPGSHFDYFLDRTRVVDNRLVFTSHSPEEQSGELEAGRRLYMERIRQRLSAVASVRNPFTALPLTQHVLQAVATFEGLRENIESIGGSLHHQEGFGLYHWAKEGPGQGAIVEIGSLMGRSTCWLAAGTRFHRREKVVAVDHFRRSAEYQKGASHPVATIADTGSTPPTFRANLQRLGLQDWVEVRVGSSAEVGAAWQGPIRLLFIDGDHSYEATAKDVATWSKHVVRDGIMAFHGADLSPGVTQFYREFVAANPSWKEFCRILSLRFIQRCA